MEPDAERVNVDATANWCSASRCICCGLRRGFFNTDTSIGTPSRSLVRSEHWLLLIFAIRLDFGKRLEFGLCRALAHGLIRASFVPPQPIQELRDLTRTRKELTREIVRHTQRIRALGYEVDMRLAA